jgi:hypothetical protein
VFGASVVFMPLVLVFALIGDRRSVGRLGAVFATPVRSV